LALDWGGTHYRWISWQILALVAGSAMLWALFAVRLLSAREPFIPLAILRGRLTSAITCAGFFSIGTVVGVTIFAPLYCQIVLGASASLSGLALIAFMVGATIGALAMGRLIVRLTHYMRVPVVGLVVAIATFGFLAVKTPELSFVAFTALLGVLGIAIGPMYPTSTIVMQNAVKPHQLGTATGALNFFRLLGGAIIVAVFGAIVLGRRRRRRRVDAGEARRGSRRLCAGIPPGIRRRRGFPRRRACLRADGGGAAAARTRAARRPAGGLGRFALQQAAAQSARRPFRSCSLARA